MQFSHRQVRERRAKIALAIAITLTVLMVLAALPGFAMYLAGGTF